MKRLFSSKIFSLVLLIAIPVAIYFINVEVQSYWGRQAFEKTGLTSLTLEDSIVKAKAENKMILVDVSAEWCGTCRKLDNEVFANEGVRKTINEKFAFSRLEYESKEGTEFLEKQNVGSFPSLWLLDSEGIVKRRLRVTFDPKEFLAQLK